MAGSKGHRFIFSPAVYSQVEHFVAQGLSAAQIADRIGCKLGSLRVKCSQHGISLRNSQRHLPKRLIISLPERVALGLQRQADKEGMSKADLAIHLLDAIVRDNLYDAVIDRDIQPKKRSATPPKARRS
jgi:hypothetical protein